LNLNGLLLFCGLGSLKEMVGIFMVTTAVSTNIEVYMHM